MEDIETKYFVPNTQLTPDGKVHDEFRLWITTQEERRFPLGLL